MNLQGDGFPNKKSIPVAMAATPLSKPIVMKKIGFSNLERIG